MQVLNVSGLKEKVKGTNKINKMKGWKGRYTSFTTAIKTAVNMK